MSERHLATSLQGTRAGFITRVVAGAIDVVIAFAAFWVVLVAIAAVRFALFEHPFELPSPGALASSTAMFVLLVVFFTVAWSGSGRTIGDVAVGLRVVTERGGALGWKRALVRAVVLLLLIVPSMLWILVSRKNAGIHDLVCRTTVIYDWRARREPMAPARSDSRQAR
jgi:uncharacterized RDD family membrane protein YckC